MEKKSDPVRFVQVLVCRRQQGATHADVQKLGDLLQRWVLRQPGFVERRMIRCEDGETYVDMVTWFDADAARAAMQAEGHPSPEEMSRVLATEAMTWLQGNSLALAP